MLPKSSLFVSLSLSLLLDEPSCLRLQVERLKSFDNTRLPVSFRSFSHYNIMDSVNTFALRTKSILPLLLL